MRNSLEKIGVVVMLICIFGIILAVVVGGGCYLIGLLLDLPFLIEPASLVLSFLFLIIYYIFCVVKQKISIVLYVIIRILVFLL